MENLIGPLAALTAALFWTLATLLYSQAGSYLSATQLNLVKGIVACPLLLIAGWFTGQLLTLEANPATYLLLASGVIGITLGDTLYFSALRRLGPWHTMLLEYLAPPFAALLAWVLLAQGMRLQEVVAAAIIILGIVVVISEKPAAAKRVELSSSGIAAGVGAALCQALGLVMSFHALQEFNMNPLNAALLRLLAGTLALTIALLFLKPSLLASTRAALRHTSIPWLLVAIVMGTFLAIWLQQTAIAYINPGLAQTLLATAPLWLIPIQWLRGQPLSLRSILGALVAVAGIALLFGLAHVS
ncbi:DMT family transporter [Pseudidiomarina sp. GXY010]|uniref:DMT family transporter n=1 Tax=Pseudidiomarina fusca TaxID=2965078 RepID=A0ABU3KVZ5_9GAMM|nr:DMT family transporter [Pseudidiomarina sp. GXY010]MDT7525061.1 DMT family transporter [Pseudidiomarina sp. GXY010]